MQAKTGFLQILKKSLYYRHWDHKDAQAVVCFLHDLGSHSGSFQFLAESLNSQNIASYALDLYGHGQTSGKRGHLHSFPKLYKVIEAMITEVKALYPGKPLIFYGQGLGATIALSYYFSKKIHIQGIIASSPWFKLTDPPFKFIVTLGEIFHYIAPRLSFKSGFSADKLSQDTSIRAAIANDSLRHNKISCRTFILSYFQGKKIAVQGYRISKPMLLLHGDQDKITSHKASVEFARNTGQYTKFISIPNGFHELHNDIVRNDIVEIVNQWIKKEVIKK